MGDTDGGHRSAFVVAIGVLVAIAVTVGGAAWWLVSTVKDLAPKPSRSADGVIEWESVARADMTRRARVGRMLVTVARPPGGPGSEALCVVQVQGRVVGDARTAAGLAGLRDVCADWTAQPWAVDSATGRLDALVQREGDVPGADMDRVVQVLVDAGFTRFLFVDWVPGPLPSPRGGR
jgi:hypothetical protein